MAAVTLLEMAKTMQDPAKAAIIGTYAMAYHPMTVMPIKTAPTGAYQWYLENALPYTTGGVRNFDGTWTRTYGRNAPKSENIRIYGGSFQVDRQIARLNPAGVQDQKEKQIKADARRFTIDFFEGADGTALRGIEDWIDNDTDYSSQSFNVGTSTTAAVLSTNALDQLLSLVDIRPGFTFIYMTDTITRMAKLLSRGSITSSNTNYAVTYTPDQWGYFAGTYDGIPIITVKDGAGTDMLTTTRATSADGSSVYAVTYGEDALCGFQSAPMEVYPLTDDTVYNFFDYEWPVGVAPQSKRCIARARYVKNALS